MEFFLIILFNSVIYGALNTDMFIDGDAYVRVDRDIRITNLRILEQNNGAYEMYGCEYSKDTTSIQVTLPNSESSIIYEVTITNKSSNNYVLFDLLEESYSNSKIEYEVINLEKGSVIDGETIYTFKIRLFTVENDSNNSGIITLKYDFSLYDEKVWLFDSVGNEQEFRVPYDGVYKLEVWGAQGGSYETYYGGYGGYSSGEVSLVKDDIIYINVGSQGEKAVGVNVTCSGGYNGGGAARSFNYPTSQSCGGGGGGYYGGGGTWVNAGGGGSGYIGNVLLSNKIMYCFNCDESNEESTRTITTTNISEEAVSNFAKKGNGYAKISLISKK